MAWTIRVSETAERQLGKLDKPVAARIRAFLRDRLAPIDDPRSLGAALRGSRLGEFWKYRVGDWRLICQIKDKEVVILLLQVGNRRDVYRP